MTDEQGSPPTVGTYIRVLGYRVVNGAAPACALLVQSVEPLPRLQPWPYDSGFRWRITWEYYHPRNTAPTGGTLDIKDYRPSEDWEIPPTPEQYAETLQQRVAVDATRRREREATEKKLATLDELERLWITNVRRGDEAEQKLAALTAALTAERVKVKRLIDARHFLRALTSIIGSGWPSENSDRGQRAQACIRRALEFLESTQELRERPTEVLDAYDSFPRTLPTIGDYEAIVKKLAALVEGLRDVVLYVAQYGSGTMPAMPVNQRLTALWLLYAFPGESRPGG